MPRPKCREWTDEETNTLVAMWPNASAMQIANTLNRTDAATRMKACELREKGLALKAKTSPRNPSIKPDLQDFDAVRGDYCRKHNITAAQFHARFEGDAKLAAELFRLARKQKVDRQKRLGRGPAIRRLVEIGLAKK